MDEYEDNFESQIPFDALEILLDLGNEFFFDPTSSIESEEYFANLIDVFDADKADLKDWLRKHVSREFRYLNDPPKWIQNPNWQFSKGRPMSFVGQVELPPRQTGLHDDAAFFIFWDRNSGETKTIIQMA